MTQTILFLKPSSTICFSLDKGCGTFLHKVMSVKPPPPLVSALQVFHVSYKFTTISLSYTIIIKTTHHQFYQMTDPWLAIVLHKTGLGRIVAYLPSILYFVADVPF